ncbi:PD40 domain-containing protein [bacterium]|nr:PD40 domain-containing protein [bacterium]
MKFQYYAVIVLLISLLFCACPTPAPDPDEPLDVGYEMSYDLREEGIVTPVKNQSPLNSCGVFAAMAVFEAVIKQVTDEVVDLSEQHFINMSDKWSNATGVSPSVVLQFMQDNGIVEEAALPYGTGQIGEQPDYAYDFKLTGWGQIEVDQMSPDLRRCAFKQALLDHGPVATPIGIYSDFDSYRSGVYTVSESATELGGHWLVVVGWLDDDSEESGGYWICKNSWGSQWGLHGFVNIAYGDRCGIDDFVLFYAEYEPGITVVGTETLPASPHGGYHTRWSPDGSKLVYTAQYDGKYELWIWDTETQTHYPTVQGVQGDLTPNWSSDSKRIVFDAYPQTGYGLQSWVRDLEQDTVYQLTQLNHHTVTPTWSIDGTQLACFDGSQLRLYNIQGGNSTIIPNSASCGSPHFKHDGSTLVCTSGPQESKDIYTIHPDGTGKTQITSFEGREDRPRWSPDGTMVVYERFISGRVDTWVTHLPTMQHFEIVQDGGNPDWLPDGRLVYCNQSGMYIATLQSDF